MIKIVRDNLLRFIFLIFVQVLILNNIQVSSYLNSYVYVLFVLLLPFETPKWLLLILGFSIGLTMDMFSDTAGMHAASTTLMAFSRSGILKIISSRKDYEQGMKPTVKDLGFKWFFNYSLVMVVIHHLCFFMLEVFKFSELPHTFLRTALSIIFTMVLLIISQYLFVKFKD